MAEGEQEGIIQGAVEGSEDSSDSSAEEVSPEVATLREELASLRAAAAKAENDKRAAEGRLRKEQDLASQFAELKAEMGDQTRAQAATLKALAAGETEGLVEELHTIEAESAKGRSARRFEAGWNSLLDDMTEIVTDENGEKVLDLDTAKELESWRAKVHEGYGRGDLASIASTLGELSRITHKARAATIDERIAAARKEEQEMAKAKMEKAGVHDLDAGRGAGGGRGSDSPAISRTDKMAAAIGKMKGQGKDFAVSPSK